MPYFGVTNLCSQFILDRCDSIYNENGVCIELMEYTYPKCSECNGDGKQICSTCNGQKIAKCPQCNQGKVNCANCYAKGTLKCNTCNGIGKWSSCKRCSGNGYVKNEPILGGFLTYTGTCSDCNGRGRGNFSCAECGGYGNITCKNCYGHTTVECNYCQGSSITSCYNCNNTGKSNLNCNICKGSGKSSRIAGFLHTVQQQSEKDSSISNPLNNDSTIDTVYTTGNRYSGKLLNGKKNGIGKLFYTDGTTFEGEWQEDTIIGLCTITYPNGNKYIGNLIKGKKNGVGITYGRTGSIVYEGEYKDDLEDGFGKLSNKGINFQGQFKSGKMHGAGEYYSKDDAGKILEFKGEFQNGLFFQGTLITIFSSGLKTQTEYIKGIKGKTIKLN